MGGPQNVSARNYQLFVASCRHVKPGNVRGLVGTLLLAAGLEVFKVPVGKTVSICGDSRRYLCRYVHETPKKLTCIISVPWALARLSRRRPSPEERVRRTSVCRAIQPMNLNSVLESRSNRDVRRLFTTLRPRSQGRRRSVHVCGRL